MQARLLVNTVCFTNQPEWNQWSKVSVPNGGVPQRTVSAAARTLDPEPVMTFDDIDLCGTSSVPRVFTSTKAFGHHTGRCRPKLPSWQQNHPWLSHRPRLWTKLECWMRKALDGKALRDVRQRKQPCLRHKRGECQRPGQSSCGSKYSKMFETRLLDFWKNRIVYAVSLCKRARKGWKAQDPKAGMFFRMRQSALHRTQSDLLWLRPGLMYDKKHIKHHLFSLNVSEKCLGTQFPVSNNWHSKSHRPIALSCIQFLVYHSLYYVNSR